MPDPITAYLDLVMAHARLAPADERRVRAELADHLHELAVQSGIDSHHPKEMICMFAKEFGDPKEVGYSIAKSKGRFRTYLKRKTRSAAVAAAVLVVLWFTVRATVAEAFQVVGNSVSPLLNPGSRCLVYKLADSYAPGDVIVYKPAENRELRFIGIVKDVNAANGELHITRNGHPDLTIARADIVGRVILNTR
jgi:hypothetical protein